MTNTHNITGKIGVVIFIICAITLVFSFFAVMGDDPPQIMINNGRCDSEYNMSVCSEVCPTDLRELTQFNSYNISKYRFCKCCEFKVDEYKSQQCSGWCDMFESNSKNMSKYEMIQTSNCGCY